MDKVFDLFMNGGSSVAILAYMIYKDNKFTNVITTTLTKMQAEIEQILKNTSKGE